MHYEVQRRFTGSKLYMPGDVVDASSWRNTSLLVSQGYILPVDSKSVGEKKESKRGPGRPRKGGE